MAIEKMLMMNLVGTLEDEDEILRQITLMGNVHLQTDINEIYENHFALHVLEESLNEKESKHKESIRGPNDEECSKILNQIEYISQALEIKPKIEEDYLGESFEFQYYKDTINNVYNKLLPINEKIQEKRTLIKKYEVFKENIRYILNQNINFDDLRNLHFFKYKIGMMSNKDKIKIVKNYENITAIAKKIGKGEDLEVFLIIYPKKFEIETEKILKSVNFEEIFIPDELNGTPKNMYDDMTKIIKKEQININKLLNGIKDIKNENIEVICKVATELKMIKKVNEIKEKIERGSNVFILSGWIPEKQKEEIVKQISKVSDKFITMFKDTNEIGETLTPPTKLKNPKWFKPFENLVKMYDIPSYNELDPTMFLAITYLIMFGAMFGDVGQGLIFVIAGSILTKMNIGSFYGSIITKFGISSTIFGFIYGSIFGNEELIPKIFKWAINPMENMNLILISAVVFGVGLIILGFIYNIINSLKIKDIQEGLFGRNGVSGFIFYIALLLIVYDIIMGNSLIPKSILIILMIISMALIVIREPLSNMIKHKALLYNESASSYYIESGFDIIETVLSLTSNTISFIRIGAFALNHVGLFLAFKTMASMANGGIGGILIMVLGNIIIIGLEGLIVFIQGLRLQYYELFGKYFKGEGIEFNPIKFVD